MLGICIPSRGLIHSRTVESLFEAVSGIGPYQLYFSHDNPIPECFNIPCEAALADGCEQILILEEDIVLDQHTIRELLKALETADIAYCDYPLDQCMAVNDLYGVRFICTGCTMFTADALRQLLPFRADLEIHPKTGELLRTLTAEEAHTKVYGYHDLIMSRQIAELGLSMVQAGVVDHYHVESYGQPRVNDGRHVLKQLTGKPEPKESL